MQNIGEQIKKMRAHSGDWLNSSLHQRLEKLIQLKETIIKHEASINDALFKDLGKSHFESYATEIGFILDEIRTTVKNLKQWNKVIKVKTPLTLFPGKSYIKPEPYGVVLIISAWNYPFQVSLAPLIGAIAAGNQVVLKPSEYAPETSKVIKKILSEVFSQDQVLVIEGGVSETQELLSEAFDYIFFTGSSQVGKLIMKAAAEHLTPLTLELGGKSPVLIAGKADLDLAAKRCVWGKFLNAGQTCVAPDYVLIQQDLQDEFLELVVGHLKNFYPQGAKKSEDYSRIINTKHFDRLSELALREKIYFGGEKEREALYFSPTILRDISFHDKIMEDEIFGPLLPIVPYGDLDEALSGIKRLPKPLAFYLFTHDQKIKQKVLNTISFGGGCINDTVVHLANPHLPFGGVGNSGIGSYHGKKSFETFSHLKSIYEQTPMVDIPLRYPPYKGKLNWIKFFLR